MILKAHLTVKFRAFGRDWGKVDKLFSVPIPAFASRLINFNDRGVSLTVDVEKETAPNGAQHP